MADIYSIVDGGPMPQTDRETQIDAEQKRYAQTNVMAEMEKFALLGTCLGTLALTCWKELEDTGLERHEMLAIVCAALAGK